MASFPAANKARAVQRMQRLHPAIKRKVQAQMADNAAELVAMQKRLAPKDDGTLASTIRHADVSDESRIAQKIEAGGPATTKPIRSGGPPTDYAVHVEHGTSDTKAVPFFFSSYRALRKRMRARLTRAGKVGIAEAVSP